MDSLTLSFFLAQKWVPLFEIDGFAAVANAAPRRPLYILTADGLFRSWDSGASEWEKLPSTSTDIAVLLEDRIGEPLC